MNVLPVTRQRAVVAATLGVVGLFSGQQALAASATWSATPTDANWTTAANWSTNAVPGAVAPAAGALSADVATFNTPIFNTIGDASNPILNDNQRQVRSFLFDTNAGAYTIGTLGGNALWLGHSGNVTMTAAVTNAQTFNAPTQIRLPSSTNGTYSLINNAAATNATLYFANLSNGSAATRPLTITLDGSNTGNNTIAQLTEGGATQVVKNGSGTWVLTGANTFSSQVDVGVTGGVVVNSGVLALQNSGALGTTTAAGNRVAGGTLRIDNVGLTNGITLDAVGTIQGNGSGAAFGSLAVAATATDPTLSTASAADVLTIGSAAGVSGGSATSTIHVAGTGTVSVGNTGTYVGAWSVDSGKLLVTGNTALGSATAANIKFGATSAGVLQLSGVNATVAGLQGTATTTAIESASGFSTLTVNNTAANQYGGLLRDGAGQLALAKGAVGVIALTNANTYTGGTTISGGSLLANNATGSATGTGTVTVQANGTLGGSGTAGGAVTVNANGRIAPGATAGAVGTLRVGSLTLDAGSQLDYDVVSNASLDQTLVQNSGGLTINGGQFNFNGGNTAFTTNGIYNLIGYAGSINGTGTSALSLNAANKNLATNTYTFGTAGGYVTLTIGNSGGTISYWNTDSNSTWSAGPWTPSQPNAVGAFAAFGPGGAGTGTAITANRTITVDSNKTVGTIAFNQPSGFSYTVNGPGTITLDNGANPSFITSTAGSHAINAPLATNANGVSVTVTPGTDTLTLGGAIGGNGAISKGGLGTLALTGNNTYTGGTTISAGTVAINSATSLGDANGQVNFNGGSLKLLADVTSGRNYNTDPSSADVKIDTNGFTLTHNGTINATSGSVSGLTKSGNGTLVLNGFNTYQGATTITGGTVSVATNAALGDNIVGAAVNLNGGTLATTANMGLDELVTGVRPVNVGAAGGALDVADGTTLTLYSLISGAGTLTKSNTGTLVLINTNNSAALNLAGGTVTAGSTLANTNGGLGSGPLTLQGGVVVNSLMPANNTLGLGNAITVPTGQTATFNAPNRFSLGGTLSGGGTLNFGVNTNVSRFDFNGNYTAFTGNINLTGTGNARFFSNGGSFNGNSFQNTTLDIGGTVFITPVTNSTGNTYLIGALTGTSATGGLGGGSAGSPNYTVGGLNTSTTFGGLITGNSILTKVGSGSLTLTNANSYTGLTNVNGGTLVINGQFALGGANYAGTTFNGGTLGYTANIDGVNGTADITADSAGVAKPVTLNASGGTVNTNGNTVTYANPIGGTGAFTKAGAGTLTFNGLNTYAGATNVTGGRLVSGTQANTTALLANANGINVANGQIELNYDSGNSPAATVRGLLKAGFDDLATPGVMETGQIRSSTATLTRGLGYKDTGTTVIIKATLFGDADLDGGVSINDFNALAGNFGQASGKVWVDGDFDYDGGVSINDFNLLAGGFGQSLPPTSELWDGLYAFAVAHNDAAAFVAITGVPEPTSLGLIAAGATLGLRRRRRSA